jgi:hypothetical protein
MLLRMGSGRRNVLCVEGGGMNRTVAIAFFLGAFFASPAFGADAFVVTMSPGVLVNPGDGYRAVELEREVRAGDQVMANETGQGWIVYCGCDEEIRPNKVYTVENRECKVESTRLNEVNYPHTVLPGGQPEVQEIKRCRGGAIGAVPLYLLGGAGIAVGACAAAGCFDDDGNDGVKKPKPASP